MARMLVNVLPYNPVSLAWFPCCMNSTLQSSSLRLGNSLEGKPKIDQKCKSGSLRGKYGFVSWEDCDAVSS